MTRETAEPQPSPPFFPDHFSGCAERYAACRPGHPPELIEHLARLAPGRSLAWDAATGNGQAAVLLAGRFERVVATDASAEQIARAAAHPQVEYHVEAAESPSLEPGSVDLVTVAQALHWLDRPRFYAAATRALRRDGVLAAWCYRAIRLEPAIDAVVARFRTVRVGPYWPRERRDVETGYRELEFPFAELPSGEWSIRRTMDRDELLGYVATWSAVAAARRAENRDPLPELAAELAVVWADASARKPVEWPIALRVGRRA